MRAVGDRRCVLRNHPSNKLKRHLDTIDEPGHEK
jgi:hypothetical protein